MREQSNVENRRNGSQEIPVGGIVLLKNDSSTGVFWKLAKVEELIPGADEKIRAAIVRVGNSER